MAGNSKEKSSRNGRKSRRNAAAKSQFNPPITAAESPSPSQSPPNESPNPNPNTVIHDESGWGYCTEEQLEELLLKNLDFVYREALAKLVSLGYDESTALQAILTSGHCYGSMDVMSNILHNVLSHLNATRDSPVPENPGTGFSDLRHLEEYSLAGIVCLLQQVRPNLSRGDAMWCLLISELHVGRASAIEIPLVSQNSASSSSAGTAPRAFSSSGVGGGLCRFHSAAALVENGGRIDSSDPWFSNLSPSMKSAIRQSAGVVPGATGFRPFVRTSLPVTNNVVSKESVGGVSDKDGGGGSSSNDIVDSVLKALEGMSIAEEGGKDPKKEMILDIIRQIKELEVQVKERKEWAQQKALQAARKLSNDMTELRMLRMERDENLRMKKGKQALEDTTVKRLSEMENALKKASLQVDRANAAVRRLELENADIRAEMEASKLSASESARTCGEATRREKKCLKKLAAWEKQKAKMLDEIAEEKKKIKEVQQQIDQVKSETKENEVKWKETMLAKEQILRLVEEERRAKEASKVNANRRLEAQRQKIELDVQRHKDDMQRLEEEHARLKASAIARQAKSSSVNALISEEDITRALQDVTITAHNGLNKPQEVPQKLNYNRKCVICKKEDVSVVYLPCAHQVVCTNCNKDHDKKGKTGCPCCNVKIEERIRVFGTSS